MPGITSQAEERLKARIAEQKARNPNGYKCTSCLKFGRFFELHGCDCVNPQYYCSSHTKNK